MSNSLELYRSRKVSRVERREVEIADARGYIQARRDDIAASRAVSHVTNVTRLTRHGIAGATLVAEEAEIAAQRSPWAAQQIASVAEAGISGIRAAIVEFSIEGKS